MKAKNIHHSFPFQHAHSSRSPLNSKPNKKFNPIVQRPFILNQNSNNLSIPSPKKPRILLPQLPPTNGESDFYKLSKRTSFLYEKKACYPLRVLSCATSWVRFIHPAFKVASICHTLLKDIVLGFKIMSLAFKTSNSASNVSKLCANPTLSNGKKTLRSIASTTSYYTKVISRIVMAAGRVLPGFERVETGMDTIKYSIDTDRDFTDLRDLFSKKNLGKAVLPVLSFLENSMNVGMGVVALAGISMTPLIGLALVTTTVGLSTLSEAYKRLWAKESTPNFGCPAAAS